MAIYEAMTLRGRGGALPQYQRQTDSYAPGAGVSARVDDSAARIASAGQEANARALAGLGRSIKDAVDVGIKAYDDYSKSKATQLITEYRRNMNTTLFGENGIMTRKGEDALSADEDRAEAARSLKEGLLKDTNPYTRHYFNLMADDYDEKTSLKAQRYAGEQRTVMLNRNDDAAAEERADFAMQSYGNAEEFAQGMGEGLWYRRQRLMREGYGGEALEHELKAYSSKVFRGAISNALTGGDVDGAEKLLRDGAGKISEGVISTRGKAGSIADDQNNPLNLRAVGGGAGRSGFRTFFSPEEGLRAADAQMLRYISGKTTGTPMDTPEKIIRTWAPSNENDTEGYIKAVAKRSGLDMSARINPNTAEGRKALDTLISAMAAQESSWNISPEQVAAARQGESTAFSGMQENGRMTGADAAWARDAIRSKREALEAKAEEEAQQADRIQERTLALETAETFMEQVRDFPEAEREGALAELCGGIEDEELRKKVWSAGKAQLQWEKAKSNAEANRQYRQYLDVAKQQGWTSDQAELNIPLATSLSDKARERLTKHYAEGRSKETPENRAAQRELLVLLDKGAEQNGIDRNDTDAIEDYAFRHSLTPSQTKAALKYAESGGAKGSLTMTMANNAAKQLFPKDADKAKKLVSDYFELIADQLEPGKKATVEQVRSILAMLLTQGESSETFGFGLGRDMTYGQALKKGEGESFIAEVPEADRKRIKALLEQAGVKEITPARIGEYYLQERRAGR